MADDTIYRQEAIDAPEKFIKDCNPEHFVGHQKFIEFMDDAEIGSFGNWQFANGFNMGLTAAEVAIKRLPSAQPERCEDCRNFNKARLLIPQPERKKGKWIYYPKASGSVESTAVHLYPVCSECGHEHPIANFCPNCGAKMEETDERS